MEPILEQYRPIILSSLKFSKFTLGTVAPQFTGTCIVAFDLGLFMFFLYVIMQHTLLGQIIRWSSLGK